MGHTEWPTVGEVTEALKSYGLADVPAHSNVAEDIASAIALCETVTGFRPFLGEIVDRTVVLDGRRSGLANLPRPMWEVVSVSVSGSLLGADEWRSFPEGGPARGIEVLVPVPVKRRAIEVVGKAGYGLEIPDDVWSAVLDLAVSRLLCQWEASGGLDRLEAVKQDTVAYRYVSSKASEPLGERLRKESLATLSRYALALMGF